MKQLDRREYQSCMLTECHCVDDGYDGRWQERSDAKDGVLQSKGRYDRGQETTLVECKSWGMLAYQVMAKRDIEGAAPITGALSPFVPWMLHPSDAIHL